jgi:hypothetical protein
MGVVRTPAIHVTGSRFVVMTLGFFVSAGGCMIYRALIEPERKYVRQFSSSARNRGVSPTSQYSGAWRISPGI